MCMVVLRVRVIVTIILNCSSQSRLSLEIDGFQYLLSSSTGGCSVVLYPHFGSADLSMLC